MTENKEITVLLSQLTPEQRAVCEPCLVKTMSSNDGKYCRLASLEKNNIKIPDYNLARSRSIAVEYIPDQCPNSYIALGTRKVR